jgi:cytochrome P450
MLWGILIILAKLIDALTDPFNLKETTISVADPKALQYIFHTSAYYFPKTDETVHFSKELFGEGIVSVSGATHQRQRKLMLPAFSVPQLRTFLEVFQHFSAQVFCFI